MIFPYIATCTAEQVMQTQLCMARGRLAYCAETPADRDRFGVLWVRQTWAPGQGAPLFGKIHAQRQRHALQAMLCQVCGGDPDEDDDGLLWLIPVSPEEALAETGGPRVSYPPICATCCGNALRMCPPLRARHSVLRVHGLRVFGIIGQLWADRDDTGLAPVTGIDVAFSYQEDLSMVLAYQQVIQLTDFGFFPQPAIQTGDAQQFRDLGPGRPGAP